MKILRLQLAFILLLTATACSSSRIKSPSAIGIVPLLQYSAQNVLFKTDTTYQVIQDATTFRASFTASSTARKPNFDGSCDFNQTIPFAGLSVYAGRSSGKNGERLRSKLSTRRRFNL